MTSIKDRILRVLADGEFHSGVELGERLSITRSAVWKKVSQLESDYGIQIESVKAKGYRLINSVELLDWPEIVVDIPKDVSELIKECNIVFATDSTNKLLMDEVDSLSDDGYALAMSEMQTAGRGRRGRTWASPFGVNLYLSLATKIGDGFSALNGISLAVGAGIADAVRSVGVPEPTLKWPNDVWVSQNKLAGVLIEVQGEQEGPVSLVVGVGLNISMTKEQGRDVDQAWTSVNNELEQPEKRNYIASTVITSLIRIIEKYKKYGFESIKPLWDSYDLLQGKAVAIHGLSNKVEGIYIGVTDKGYAKLRLPSGEEQEFSGGEISLRINS